MILGNIQIAETFLFKVELLSLHIWDATEFTEMSKLSILGLPY